MHWNCSSIHAMKCTKIIRHFTYCNNTPENLLYILFFANLIKETQMKNFWKFLPKSTAGSAGCRCFKNYAKPGKVGEVRGEEGGETNPED